MTVEHVAVAALAVEVVIMVLARVSTERRHWNHAQRGAAAPLERDDITRASGVLYAIAAVAMMVGAVVTPVALTLRAVGTFALFGILLPAFAANSVLVLATRGNPAAVTAPQRGLAFAVAAGGGALSAALV
ncbi:hypothetical protein G3I20_07980 [Streptomyces sp. SID8111]|uniref:hypothetical protein n=1 Tax=Streptomyces sp. SID8111 TaxID=2706100 RepID=UPI0013BFC06B|nr:hypothetical protein [Streptomyces sp. SID8111]NEC26496.1 hypothetical protein [Streptomyces sp. SID8111]